VIGVLASGYEFAQGGRDLVIRLRPGVKFSDGTPFDAQAVKSSLDRTLKEPCCSPAAWPWADGERVTTLDEHTVVLHFSQPYGPAINSFPATSLNWIASTAALGKMGPTEFRVKPVGAGPFRVVSNQFSTKLVLERNPLYWQEGRPYLDGLTFQSINSEQAGYQALLAGDAHAFEGMGSVPLIEQAEKSGHLTVLRQLPVSVGMVQLNTTVPPFDNLRAREALYYATDVKALNNALYKGKNAVSQSFTASGGLFFHDTVPGYRTYDREKARAIVKELGGLQVRLGTIRSFLAEQFIAALQSQWQQAGIEVTLEPHDLGALIAAFEGKKWQAMLQFVGSYDPDSGSGLPFRFGSASRFSGVKDKELDALIAQATATTDSAEREKAYLSLSRHLSDHAYGPFLIALSPAQLSRGIHGPGLTTKIPAQLVSSGILWQDVWVSGQ
jgi:peptide/nickel transport system substrate-binding protein